MKTYSTFKNSPSISVLHRGFRRRLPLISLFAFAHLLSATLCMAQIPRINTFFPIGGRAGSTVDVEIRGSSLEGAHQLLIHGSGVTGTVSPGNDKVDETNKPLLQAKCQGCHELRSPANRSMTPGQWAATVERMVKLRQAPLSADDAAKVTAYLVGAAKAGRVTASLNIAQGTLSGIVEVRLVTSNGISTPSFFEVGNLPEVMAASTKWEQAQPVSLPCIVNGCFMSNGEHHYFRFKAKKEERLVFNLKGYRYNDTTQLYFNPNLRLYDSTGKELVENHGYYEFDPVIDWTCPADGEYTIEARDLLGHSNPGSVYRLVMGHLPYDLVVSPPVVQSGMSAPCEVFGKDIENLPNRFTLTASGEPGIQQSSTPFGPAPYLVSHYPVTLHTVTPGGASGSHVLPQTFAGSISKAGDVQLFNIQGNGLYEISVFSSRLGAEGAMRVSLLNSKGAAVKSITGDNRMAAKLEPAEQYQLKVEEASGLGGPQYVYAIEARESRPGVRLTVNPDNVTLRPGMSTAVEVTLGRRRAALEGDVIITAENLPSGVTAKPAVIQPDRDTALLVLTAASNAPMTAQPIRITGKLKGAGGEVTVAAQPQELYRLNNEPRTHNWSDIALAVCGESKFSLELQSAMPVKVHPRKGVEVKVKIHRKPGFTGSVTVYINGLPRGWVANQESTNGDTITMTVRPDGNDTRPFLTRDPKFTPITAILEASSDEFHFVFADLPIVKSDKISDRDDDR